MKKIFLLFLFTCTFTSLLSLMACDSQTKELTENEIKLITEMGIDIQMAQEIKALSSSELMLSEGNTDREFIFEDDENLKNYEATLPLAIEVKAKSAKAEEIFGKYRDRLKANGIIVYFSEQNYGYEDDEVTFLKSNNTYEPLFFEATNAVNYDIYTAEIVEKIKAWDVLYDLDIFGVGVDFVIGAINKLPSDTAAFAQEMYEFCPDIVDQGAGDVEVLEQELITTKTIFLWWD